MLKNLPKENYHEKKTPASLCPVTYGSGERHNCQRNEEIRTASGPCVPPAQKSCGLPLQESRNEFEGSLSPPPWPHTREILGAGSWGEKKNSLWSRCFIACVRGVKGRIRARHVPPILSKGNNNRETLSSFPPFFSLTAASSVSPSACRSCLGLIRMNK